MPISASLNSKKYRSSSFGKEEAFTLIEMLITISIIGLLISITATSSTDSRRQFLLTSSQEQLRSLLSRAKSLTVSTVLSGSARICGYGVHIDKVDKAAFIFRDLTSGSCPGDNRYNEGERMSGTLNELKLDKALSFGGDVGDILFVPPDPSIVINGDATFDDRSYLVTVSSGNQSRKLKVNKAGLIDLVLGN